VYSVCCVHSLILLCYCHHSTGTGASCIYPLLGARLNGWSFLATEIDRVSAEYAAKNVKTNNFTDNITSTHVCYLVHGTIV